MIGRNNEFGLSHIEVEVTEEIHTKIFSSHSEIISRAQESDLTEDIDLGMISV